MRLYWAKASWLCIGLAYILCILWSAVLLFTHATSAQHDDYDETGPETCAETQLTLLAALTDYTDKRPFRKNSFLSNLHQAWNKFWRIPEKIGSAVRPVRNHNSDIATEAVVEGRIARLSRTETYLSNVDISDRRTRTTEITNPFVGMMLDVYEGSESVTHYQLLEPLELELGVTVQHLGDYAYLPVATKEIDAPKNARDSVLAQKHLVQESYKSWWDWWLPWRERQDRDKDFFQYKMDEDAFAGGSHGEVWRGNRRCRGLLKKSDECTRSLVFKRLKVEQGYRILEAGLREVYFGSLLSGLQEAPMFTRYIDHFFRESSGDLELWIVFLDAGSTLRSFLYEGSLVGDYLVYQHSFLWTQLRLSLSGLFAREQGDARSIKASDDEYIKGRSPGPQEASAEARSIVGRQLMGTVLREILEGASILHTNGIIHRDIKPSNIMCTTNLDWEKFRPINKSAPLVSCVLGDFSSAWNEFTDLNMYTRGPSRNEQTDDYAPPEAIFGALYHNASAALTPKFDSWSIGIVALELLLGTPNVFTVDQRTTAILHHRMEKDGASDIEIQQALYLAALSQFCIYDPLEDSSKKWPYHAATLQKSSVKQSCTINDFHRALRARDPLGIGFDSSADTLLHLIWKLLEWNPDQRITPAQALQHAYFTRLDPTEALKSDSRCAHMALEDQMLDPRMDFNTTDIPTEFTCPKCGKIFGDLLSCHQHALARRHGRFCSYDTSNLPTCLNAHRMLPVHYSSGYCDIQGRRRFIEDFHSIHLGPSQQFYAIFDGHTGNIASKFAASVLYRQVLSNGHNLDEKISNERFWRDEIRDKVKLAFRETHAMFLKALAHSNHGFMNQSGTTATSLIVTNKTVVIAHLGDSRAVLPSRNGTDEAPQAIQLTTDHTAAVLTERQAVEERGGYVELVNGIFRVNGSLVITRSLGDAYLAPFLSQEPDVLVMTKDEVGAICGGFFNGSTIPCFVILASDGLFDKVTNDEAVDMVVGVLEREVQDFRDWRLTAGLHKAAEALTQEAFVRGSSDNIGVCVVAIE